MNSVTNIINKLKENRINESAQYYVIDKTDGTEKYKVPSKEAAEQRVQELIDQGSDRDKITISPIGGDVSSADLDEAEEDDSNKAYEEFKKACMSNPTWKKANAICEKYGYKLSPTSCVSIYPSGKKVPKVRIMVDYTKEYYPEIYYYAGKFGNNTPTIEIQTTAYGSLTLEKHAEFLESVTNAHKMVEELSKIDFTTLHEDKADY